MPRGASRSLLQKAKEKKFFSFSRFCSNKPNDPRGKPVGLGCHGLAPWCLTFAATGGRKKKFFCSLASVATNLTIHGASPWDWDATGLPRGASRSPLQEGERRSFFRSLASVATNLTIHGASPWDWDATGLPRGASRSPLQEGERRSFFRSLASVATNLTNHGTSPWDWDATGLPRGASRSRLQ